jgi:hypothetical protein
VLKGLAAGLGVLLVLLLAAVLCGSSKEDYETCAVCGAWRVHASKMGLPLGWSALDDDCSRWILSFHSGIHEHSWVHTHTHRKGWGGMSVACSMTGSQASFLSAARERVGEDPALAALVREYLAACDAGSVDFEALARRAAVLGQSDRDR